jgi:hypothetical protein
VRVAVVAGTGGSALLCELAADGSPRCGPVSAKDLIAAVAGYEQSGPVRWVWASGARLYPSLLRAGVRVARCHDVELTERLLASRDGPGGPGGPDLAGLAAAASRKPAGRRTRRGRCSMPAPRPGLSRLPRSTR